MIVKGVKTAVVGRILTPDLNAVALSTAWKYRGRMKRIQKTNILWVKAYHRPVNEVRLEKSLKGVVGSGTLDSNNRNKGRPPKPRTSGTIVRHDDQGYSPPPQVNAMRIEVMLATSRALPAKSTRLIELRDTVAPLGNALRETRTIPSVNPASGRLM